MTIAPLPEIFLLEEATHLRQKNQLLLDQRRTKEERNRLGQFATPNGLAADVAEHALRYFPDHELIHVLEPAVGLGSLWDALLSKVIDQTLQGSAFEIDIQVAEEARGLWSPSGLTVTTGNFTAQLPPAEEQQVDLLLSNPPYVRHHHLDLAEKKHLRQLSEVRSGIKPNGYMGLYGYFMLLAHAWIKPGGIAVWLIPTEFMDVGYGEALKSYLLKQVTLLSVHTFTHTNTQFEDALVSSAIVTYRMERPGPSHEIEFTSGDSLLQPSHTMSLRRDQLTAEQKWSGLSRPGAVARAENEIKLGDLFDVRRGAATGDNSFFILEEARARELGLPEVFLRPVLPSPRYLKTDRVLAGEDGRPVLDPVQVLIDCSLPLKQVEEQFPALWAYLRRGVETGVSARYLCAHRMPWYKQEQRAPAPFLCTYMGRGRDGGNPFRFILNESQATATNVYLLLYPKGEMADLLGGGSEVREAVWKALNALGGEVVKREGRVYGGGLHKVEPSELLKSSASSVIEAARAVAAANAQSL